MREERKTHSSDSTSSSLLALPLPLSLLLPLSFRTSSTLSSRVRLRVRSLFGLGDEEEDVEEAAFNFALKTSKAERLGFKVVVDAAVGAILALAIADDLAASSRLLAAAFL